MKFLRLLKLIVLKNIREEKFLTLLSILGIALGIGLFVGVKIATDRAVISFEEHVQGLNPYANYEVVDISGVDFDETLYKSIRSIEDRSFPVIRANGYLPDRKITIDINGIYTVRVASHLGFSTDRSFDIEGFFKKLNAVLITRTFAERHRIKKGDILHAFVYNQQYLLDIVDIVDIPSLPSHTVLMDIGNFQEYFGKSGLLTKIDIETDEKTALGIQRILPLNLALENKQHVIRQHESLIASFRYNLQFITFLAVLVGVFLLYNTVFISVVKRREEIGILRGLGTKKRTTVLLFTVHGLILGFIGSVAGILFGQFFSYFSVIAVEKTVSAVYRSISIADYLITGSDAVGSLLLGLFVSFCASFIPALESAHVRPNESSKAGSLEKQYKRRQKIFSLIGLVSILAGTGIVYVDYRYIPFDFPYLSYAGILLFIMGCTFNAPVFLSLVLRIFKIPARILFGAAGKITVSDIEGSRYRFSVALMSVAISAALIVALLSSITSLKNSFKDWLLTYLIADAYVKPASCKSNYCFDPLPDKVISTIENSPEVDDIGKFRALQIDFQGQKVVAGFGNTAIWSKYRKRMNLSTTEQELLQRLSTGKKASISEYLKVKYGLMLGDEITIQTPRGKEAFTVNYTSISYSTTSGFIYMDRQWLKELWGMDDATQLTVYLKEGTDTEQFIMKQREQLSNTYALNIVDNSALRRESLDIFDKSFTLTYAIELIAIIISMIGVINTLLILVFEKKREISIIRYLGGSWHHITKTMILSGGLVGAAGIVFGIIMGPAISMVIIHVINKISFGWEVRLHVPFLYLTILMVILFLTTVLAGFIPSRVARKIDPKSFISFE
jgi:putative ABC transport system permease protein